MRASRGLKWENKMLQAKRSYSQRTGSVHRCFFVVENQHGRRDVMWKRLGVVLFEQL